MLLRMLKRFMRLRKLSKINKNVEKVYEAEMVKKRFKENFGLSYILQWQIPLPIAKLSAFQNQKHIYPYSCYHPMGFQVIFANILSQLFQTVTSLFSFLFQLFELS